MVKQSLRDRNALSAAMTPAINIVEENRDDVNFEFVERLVEREERDWSYFGQAPPRAREEASRSARCADRGRPPAAASEEAPGTSDAELSNNNPPLAAFLALATLGSLCKADLPRAGAVPPSGARHNGLADEMD